ncbi:PHD and RING finger domain-containing protein 1-like isoform X2 [Hoplias malabaricus]|uniref:PHD and RING finger domain-containing protein 1-like isoform X2 n=1 Tax=Hoplias malabaricus TaxID=27720 RepID=UPI0034624E9B
MNMDDTHLKDLSLDWDEPHTVRCLICLNAFSGQSVATPQQCEHLYCLTCITEWAKMTNSCPVDRLEFNVLYQRTGVGGGIQKTVTVQAPQGEALQEGNAVDLLSVCEECGRSDRRHLMLLCSACDSSPPLSAVPFEDWICQECSGLFKEAREIDEAEVMDLLSEVVPTSSRLRTSTSTRPTVYTRRSERVRQQDSRRHASVPHPVQHVPKYLLKTASSATDEDVETNSLTLKTQKSDRKKTAYKKKTRR